MFIGSPLETIEIKVRPVFLKSTVERIIWLWDDGKNQGFLQLDMRGWSSIRLGLPRDDEVVLASWYNNIDVRKLKRLGGPEAIRQALKDAMKRE